MGNNIKIERSIYLINMKKTKSKLSYLHIPKLYKIVRIILQNDEIVVRGNFVDLSPPSFRQRHTSGVARVGVHIQQLSDEEIELKIAKI